MKSYKKIIIFLMLISAFIGLNAMQCNGQNTSAWDKLKVNMAETKKEAGYPEETTGETDLAAIIANIIKIILSFIGAIFLILVIWGGNLWMMAGGNEEQIKKAKDFIKNGAIGLAIILAAYMITYLLTQVFISATGV
ncbi:MAG: hypothetical protein V1891_03130 [bacterium]